MSASLPLMLSMMIGMAEYSRIRWQTSRPLQRGITRSRSTSSGDSRSNASNASSPSVAVIISYPCVVRACFTATMMPGSSSTSKIRCLEWLIEFSPLCAGIAQYGFASLPKGLQFGGSDLWQWKCEVKDTSTPQSLLHPDRSAMRIHNAPADGETQAVALHGCPIMTSIQAIETPENLLPFFQRHPWAAITDPDQHLGSSPPGFYLNRGIWWRIPVSIFQEIP